MKVFTRQVFLTKESISLLDKDINAKPSYTIFSNKEEDTVEVELSISVPEEFRITEDLLLDIVQGLLPHESEQQHQIRLNTIINHLRLNGQSL